MRPPWMCALGALPLHLLYTPPPSVACSACDFLILFSRARAYPRIPGR